nr:helix-turn-helix domain-containing protein [Rhodococcus sp. (in: high G+C Gram-positive bacteria)]
MALRSDWSDKVCPVARTLDIVGDPWIMVILREVFAGNRRFDTLKTKLDVADTVLSKRLETLVDANLLRRDAYSGNVRPRFDYNLTDAGLDTLPIIHALARWGNAHLPRHDTPPMRIYCRRCSIETSSADWCITCAAPLTADTTLWRTAGNPEVELSLAPR